MKETTLAECDVAIEIQPSLTVDGNAIVSLHCRRPLLNPNNIEVHGVDRIESDSRYTLRFVVGRLFDAAEVAAEVAMVIADRRRNELKSCML